MEMSKERTVRYSADQIRKLVERGGSKTDWARVDASTDAQIEALRRDDPDWFGDVDWSNATVVVPVPKSAVSIRLDSDVLDFFKAQGKGYQTRINAVLRHYMQEKLKNG